MRYIKNCNGGYARHFVENQRKFQNKGLERRVEHTSQMLVYDPNMLDIDPILFLIQAMAKRKH